MRNLSTLYGLLLKEGNNMRIKANGICREIDQLHCNRHITYFEYETLRDHFKDQKPTSIKHAKFYFSDRGLSAYWWPCDDSLELGSSYRKGHAEIRRKFIEHLSKETRK